MISHFEGIYVFFHLEINSSALCLAQESYALHKNFFLMKKGLKIVNGPKYILWTNN